MKRRSKAGGKPAKAQRPKTPKLKRRTKSNEATRRTSSAHGEKGEVVRLTRELNEAQEQQTATSEVLHLISGSHSDLALVFDTILANATRLCDATFGILSLHEEGAFRVVAMHNAPPAFAELRRREPVIRVSALLRMVATK